MRNRLLVCLLVATLFAWLFAEALFTSRLFVMRDAAHYYYPLFKLVQDEWAAGRVPLWNPYENLGVPLAAGGTASVFYPGKLVFFLPLGFDLDYKLYLLAHVLLAAGAAYALARAWDASVLAGGVAAISYAFCGNVLYQYANAAFLVGAAWMPLAVWAAERMWTGRRMRAAIGLGTVLALMILGGDPQAAYHALLLAGLRAVFAGREAGRAGEGGGERRGASLGWLILAALTAGLLAAVQILPSWEFAGRSDRAATATARSLYEIPSALRHDDARRRILDGLLCRPAPHTHHASVYEFSVGPWRWPEYIWPNVAGRQFPVNRRWLEIVPDEGRVWTPSLYMGLLPLLLALSQWRLWRAESRTAWLSWIVLLAVLASLGEHGLGWVAQRAGHVDAARVGEPVGGLYWLMTVLLPGYLQFRFPAKLLTVAALGLSLLAARGWDAAWGQPAVGLRRTLGALGVLSLLLALAAWVVRPWWAAWMADVPPSGLFGPLDAWGAWRDLHWSFQQTAVLCGAFLWLIARSGRAGEGTGGMALVLVAIDLALANGWMVVCGPADAWHAASPVADALRKDAAARGDTAPLRVVRRWDDWLPPAWSETASPARPQAAVRWDRATLWPNYQLFDRIGSAEVYGTIEPADYRAWISAAPSERALARSVAAPYVIGPRNSPRSDCRPVEVAGVDDAAVWCVPAPMPRAWITHQFELRPEIDPRDFDAVRQATADMWKRPGRVVVEALPQGATETQARQARQIAVPKEAVTGRPPPHELAEISHYDPQQVELRACLERPGLVVLAEQFDPDWRASVAAGDAPLAAASEVPILRVNRVLRGVWLPAGRQRLRFVYRPWGFWSGAVVSALAWIALGTGWIGAWWLARRRKRAGQAPPLNGPVARSGKHGGPLQ